MFCFGKVRQDRLAKVRNVLERNGRHGSRGVKWFGSVGQGKFGNGLDWQERFGKVSQCGALYVEFRCGAAGEARFVEVVLVGLVDVRQLWCAVAR